MTIARSLGVLMVALLVSQAANSHAMRCGGPPKNLAQALQSAPPSRPAEITKVYPDEDAIVDGPTPEVGADLVLNAAMRKGGEFDSSTVALTLDDRDVTARALVRGTMDYPQSRVTMIYTPDEPLAEGRHEAALTLPAEKGRTTYRWSFNVRRNP
jgi:hypothetical protein